MSQTVYPSQTFTVVLEDAPPGETGTMAVRIDNLSGTTIVARTTTGVTEIVAGSGIYTKTDIVAPSTEGSYLIIWDDGSDYASEDLTVSGAVSSGPSVSTLVSRTRRALRDWPDEDATTGSASSSATSITVADTTKYYVNMPVEVDSEMMIVRALASATSLTVKRGAFGTTADAHASGATVLLKPRHSTLQILDALSAGVDAAFPYVYKRIIDTSLTSSAGTVEYTVPTMSGDTFQFIPFIHRVELKFSGETDYFPTRHWRVDREDTPTIHFLFELPAGTSIKVFGYGRFPRLDTLTDVLDSQWPRNLEYPLVEYAVSCCLASGEYGRVATDRGVIDDREQANRVGASMSASQYAYQKYMQAVMNSGYPPMPRRVIKAL